MFHFLHFLFGGSFGLFLGVFEFVSFFSPQAMITVALIYGIFVFFSQWSVGSEVQCS